MKFFSMPADFKTETIDQYAALNNTYPDSRIIETYGQLTVGDFLGSGRMFDLLPPVDYRHMQEYIHYSNEKGIAFNYIFNPSCLGNMEFSRSGVYEIKDFLSNLYRIGVRSLTVTLPSLIELVKATPFDFEIKASAICDITSPDKALFYKQSGARRVVLNTDLNKDFGRIKNICSCFGEGVEIIINSLCMKNCPYKIFHYNHESHSKNDFQEIKNYYFQRCTIQKASRIENIIKLNWIRPEDLQYYIRSGVRYFKIQGRNNVVSGDPVKAVEYYIKEDYDGNLYDLLMLYSPLNAFQPYIENKKLDGYVKRFFDDPHFCKSICHSCGYCASYSDKSIDRQKSGALNQGILKLYHDSDEYRQLIHKRDVGMSSKDFPSGEFLETDFEFED